MKIKHILAAVDFSGVTDGVVDAAETLALVFASPVTFLHVEAPDPAFVGYEAGPQHVRDNVARQTIEDHQRIIAVRESLQEAGVECHGLVVQGPTIEKILEEAERVRADVIVIGSHGHGMLYDLVLGSVSDGVTRKAKCAVLVVPDPGRG
jgi:nucleotide-binding universal stress UspA family protein